jgi:hypothetical protein
MHSITVRPELKKELLSLCYALESWRHAQAALIKLRDDAIQPDHVLYEVLTTAVVVLYMRPFEKSHGLRPLRDFEQFESDGDGQLLKDIHEAVDKTRNQILAHQQLSGWDKLLQHFQGAERAGKLVVSMGPPLSYEVQSPTLSPDMAPFILRLMNYQSDRVQLRFIHELSKVLPQNTSAQDFSIVG